MDPTLKTKILERLRDEFASYSPRMRIMAKYILDNPADFGLNPVRVTAARVGVSTYTLVRLAKALGFDTFEELRGPFRHALVATTPYESMPSWIDEQRGQGPHGGVQAEAAANTLSIVQTTLQRQTPQELDAVCELLVKARTVYVTGVRASYSIAYFLHYVGRMALPSLQLIPRHMNSAIDELLTAGPGDVLVAIAVSPYSRETIEACKYAEDRGVDLVLLSDSDIVSADLNPAHILVSSTVSTHYFACFTGVMALAESLLAALVARAGADGKARIQAYEQLRSDSQAYMVPPQKKR